MTDKGTLFADITNLLHTLFCSSNGNSKGVNCVWNFSASHLNHSQMFIKQ